MFQISAAYALALENNNKAIFNLDEGTFPHHPPSYYADTIFRKLELGNITNPNIYQEPNFYYDEIPYVDFKNGICLEGYFQSEKYFKKYRKEILELFEPTTQINNYIHYKYGHLFEKDTIGLHVRRGDYLQYQDHHPICNIFYYNKALFEICGDVRCHPHNILVFSDDPEWCRNNFKSDNFTIIEEESDIIDLYLMSKCQHQVIANSSFSWWGTWLNQNPDKKVVAPKHWFGNAYSHINTKDLIPKEWITV